MEQHLALIVRRSAAEEQPAALDGFERRSIPLGERLDRLHIVVAIDQYSGSRRIASGPLREHRRVTGRVGLARRPHFDNREPPLSANGFAAIPRTERRRRAGWDRRKWTGWPAIH